MKRRSILMGFMLLLVALPAEVLTAQSNGINEKNEFALASNLNTVSESPIQAVNTNSYHFVGQSLVEEPGKMVLYYDNDVITLSFLNEDKSKAYFSIEDEKGNVLFSERFVKDSFVHSRVLMNKVPSGKYVAIFKTANDLFRKSFVVAE